MCLLCLNSWCTLDFWLHFIKQKKCYCKCTDLSIIDSICMRNKCSMMFKKCKTCSIFRLYNYMLLLRIWKLQWLLQDILNSLFSFFFKGKKITGPTDNFPHQNKVQLKPLNSDNKDCVCHTIVKFKLYSFIVFMVSYWMLN